MRSWGRCSLSGICHQACCRLSPDLGGEGKTIFVGQVLLLTEAVPGDGPQAAPAPGQELPRLPAGGVACSLQNPLLWQRVTS